MSGWNLGWKSILGAVVTAVGYLSQPDVLALLPHTAASIVSAVGGVLSVIGLRAAVSKT